MSSNSSNKKTYKNHLKSSVEEKLKYAIDNNDATIETKKLGQRKGTQKVITIDGKSYQYNPKKTISKVLTTKLTQLTKTKQFEATQEIKQVYERVRLQRSQLLKTYASKFKANISEVQSAFNNYINAFSISNIKLKNLNGLSYIKYEYERLKQFLVKNPCMKILISVFVTVESYDDDSDEWVELEKRVEIRSRRYEICNLSDLQDTLNNASADIILQIQNAQLTKSNLRIKGIDKIVVNYDRFNPTRGGSYIELPKYIADKKACINIKNDDNKCFKYSVQCGFYKTYEQKNPQEIRHYNKLNDSQINWEGVKYPCGNRDIDRFEENNKGLLSVNIYHEFDYNGTSSIAIQRRPKIVNAKHYISLLNIEDHSGKYHYV